MLITWESKGCGVVSGYQVSGIPMTLIIINETTNIIAKNMIIVYFYFLWTQLN